MALTKTETQKLADILHNLKTAQKYISQPEVKIIDTKYKTGFKEDIFTNGTGVQVGLNVNKEIGSDIVYLRNAIDKLQYLLYPPKIETDEN
jgi:fumarate hydratase class II